MSIILLAARAAKNHRNVAWIPTSLYSGGTDGAWFDPSDFSTMFQDAAGTVPVNAVGQAVALIKDKSGNAHNASQAVAANRPTLTQDDKGRYCLSFSGTQYLDCGTGFNASVFCTCVAYNCSGSVANSYRVLDTRGSGAVGTVQGWQLKAWTTSGPPLGTDGFVVDSGSAFIASQHQCAANTNHVGYFDYVTSSAVRYDFEGASGLTTVTGSALGSITSTKTSRIGAASNDGSQGFLGLMYQIIVAKKVPTSTEIANMRVWCSTKSGVTL